MGFSFQSGILYCLNHFRNCCTCIMICHGKAIVSCNFLNCFSGNFATHTGNVCSQVVEPYLEGYKSGKYFDGKFIIVGDFTEYDIHTTITGNQPGPVVVFNALLSLMEGDNILPFWVYLLVYVVFWLESMFLLRNKFELNLRSFRIFRQIRARFYRKRRPGQRMGIHNTLYLLLGFFTYSTPLWIMGVALYAVLGIFVNVIIVGTVFWVISWFV